MTDAQKAALARFEAQYPPSQRRVLKRKPSIVPADYVVVSVTVPRAPCWARYAIAPDGREFLVLSKTLYPSQSVRS